MLPFAYDGLVVKHFFWYPKQLKTTIILIAAKIAITHHH